MTDSCTSAPEIASFPVKDKMIVHHLVSESQNNNLLIKMNILLALIAGNIALFVCVCVGGGGSQLSQLIEIISSEL